MPIFQYHPAIASAFPQVCGGVIAASGLRNGPAPASLQQACREEQQAVLARLGDTPLSKLPTLAAWRAAFRKFGVNPTRYRSATEALLRRLSKKGDIPSINILVDICNLVSIRYALPVAAFDTQALHGGVTVRFATGGEKFYPLGAAQPEQPATGEVIFSDERELVIARRWCWRQSRESAANPKTTQAIFTVEAQHPGGRQQVSAALQDLATLLQEHSGGDLQSALLDASQRVFPA